MANIDINKYNMEMTAAVAVLLAPDTQQHSVVIRIYGQRQAFSFFDIIAH